MDFCILYFTKTSLQRPIREYIDALQFKEKTSKMKGLCDVSSTILVSMNTHISHMLLFNYMNRDEKYHKKDDINRKTVDVE